MARRPGELPQKLSSKPYDQDIDALCICKMRVFTVICAAQCIRASSVSLVHPSALYAGQRETARAKLSESIERV